MRRCTQIVGILGIIGVGGALKMTIPMTNLREYSSSTPLRMFLTRSAVPVEFQTFGPMA